jgi:CelD/BcsL family acetyltransferase involved in cellulose biosynthesis
MQTADSQFSSFVGPMAESSRKLAALREFPAGPALAEAPGSMAVGAVESASAGNASVGNVPVGSASAGSATAFQMPSLAAPLRVRRVAPALNGNGAATALAATDDLEALAGVWNSLAGNVPFRSFEWIESWWRHYRLDGWQTYLLKIEDGTGQIVGIAPWYISRSPLAGRVIQFMGSGEACSEDLSLLARPGREAAVAAEISDWLATEGVGDWDMLLMAGVQEADPATTASTEDFASRGNLIHRRPGMPCWRCELPPTWDEFVRRLSRSRRERVRQLTRKYFDTGRVQIRWVTTPAELDQAFPMFVDMHQRRRQSLGQPGCYASRQFANFHREVSRRLCAAGKLRLLWTELDGRPVAAEYDFIDGKTVYYYSTGVEPAAVADHPGWLAMIGSLRRAIEEGCQWFDFLRGDEAYKCSWGAKPFPTVETRIIARRRLARIRHSAWLTRQQLRQWAKGVKEWGATRRPKNEESKEPSKKPRSENPVPQP